MKRSTETYRGRCKSVEANIRETRGGGLSYFLLTLPPAALQATVDKTGVTIRAHSPEALEALVVAIQNCLDLRALGNAGR